VSNNAAASLFLARPTQDREVIELQEFAVSRGFDGAIQLWDLPYWKRKQCAFLFGYDSCIQNIIVVEGNKILSSIIVSLHSRTPFW
jgi:hypothetical protein